MHCNQFSASLAQCVTSHQMSDLTPSAGAAQVILTQTDRCAQEMRKELAKMQRERDKLREWIAERVTIEPEMRETMETYKCLVEATMYRFRTFEKNWKHGKGIFAGDVRPDAQACP